MKLAWENSPTSLFLGAQPSDETFFQKPSFQWGLEGHFQRKPRPNDLPKSEPEVPFHAW